jgi:hypothetical protein
MTASLFSFMPTNIKVSIKPHRRAIDAKKTYYGTGRTERIGY